MFTVYLDDSGTDPNQHAAIATALLIPAKQVVPLEREWNNFKRKEGFSSLHFSEMIAKNQKSEFADWDDAKIDRVFQRARDISKKYSVALGGVSFSVKKADYDEVVPSELRANLGNHYTWAIRHVIVFLDNWRASVNFQQPIEYVFDWMGGPKDSRRLEVEEVMAQSEAIANLKGRYREYTGYSFRRRQDLPGLQCVDGMGWVSYRQALLMYRGTPLLPTADLAWKDYGADKGPKGWLQVFTVNRKNLEKWVGLEMADGRTLKRFEEWKKSRTMSS